jgi:hypothetical protein
MEDHPALRKNQFIHYISLNSLIQKIWDNDRQTCLLVVCKS